VLTITEALRADLVIARRNRNGRVKQRIGAFR
jgi:hypothetical protein